MSSGNFTELLNELKEDPNVRPFYCMFHFLLKCVKEMQSGDVSPPPAASLPPAASPLPAASPSSPPASIPVDVRQLTLTFMQQLQSQDEKFEDQFKELQSQIANLKGELMEQAKEVHEQNKNRTKENQELQNQITKIKEENEALQQQYSGVTEQNNNLRQQITKIKEEAKELISQCSGVTEQQKDLQQQIINLSQENKEFQRDNKNMQEEIKELVNDKVSHDILMDKLNEHRALMDRYQEKLENVEDQKHLSNEFSELRTANQQQENQLDNLQNTFEELFLSLTSCLHVSDEDRADEDDESDGEGVTQGVEESELSDRLEELGRKLRYVFQFCDQHQENIPLQPQTEDKGGTVADLKELVDTLDETAENQRTEYRKLEETMRSLKEENKQQLKDIEKLYKIVAKLEEKIYRHPVGTNVKDAKSALQHSHGAEVKEKMEQLGSAKGTKHHVYEDADIKKADTQNSQLPTDDQKYKNYKSVFSLPEKDQANRIQPPADLSGKKSHRNRSENMKTKLPPTAQRPPKRHKSNLMKKPEVEPALPRTETKIRQSKHDISLLLFLKCTRIQMAKDEEEINA